MAIRRLEPARLTAALLAASVTVATTPAIALDLSLADVERALTIARGRDRDRAAFHAPYLIALKTPFVQSVEIITEFRRVVLIAEEHLARGDRRFAFSARLAQEAASVWKNRVSIVARLQFHPQNTYVNVPDIAMSLDGPSGTAALIGIRRDAVPALAPAPPGQGQPILGALVEAVYDAAIIGRTKRTLTIRMEGKELAKVALDLASVQ